MAKAVHVRFLMEVGDVGPYGIGTLTVDDPTTYNHEVAEALRGLADEFEKVDNPT